MSLGLFIAAWLVHVAWWRCSTPKHHYGSLLVVFSATLGAGIGVFFVGGVPSQVLIWDLPGILALYVGAVACYLITYTAVEQTSPSLLIIGALEKAGGSGCSHEELTELVTQDKFIRPRLEALKRNGMIKPATGGFVLTARGRTAAKAAAIFSRIFNIRRHA